MRVCCPAVEKLMKSDLFFLLENASWPALLVEESGTIRRCNQAAVDSFGAVLEGEQTSLSAIWSSENSSTAEKFLGNGEAARGESMPLKFQIKGGVSSAYSTAISTVNREGHKYFIFQLFKNSATESSNAQKQKLDCALQLARSVALDFNNTLTGILGHSSFLLAHAEPNHPWRNSLMEIEKSALKAAEISNDLAAFSRNEKEPRVQAAGNLNTLLQRTVAAFRTPDRARISWSLQLERRLFSAVFDEAKIQQAFTKILENAIESIPTEGRIAVQTRNLELSAPTQDLNAKLSAGTYICVEISDTGTGIDGEKLPRDFHNHAARCRAGFWSHFDNLEQRPQNASGMLVRAGNKTIGLVHRNHHRAVIIRLEQRFARLFFFHAFVTAHHFVAFDKIIEILAFGGIDDANTFERNIDSLRGFFHFRAVAQQNRRAEAKGIKLPRRLQHARFGAFRENHTLGVTL